MSKAMYEGKAKQVFRTDNENEVLIRYKDDATAFNGEKKGQIAGKGEINNSITSILFTLLEDKGIQTHFIRKINERDQLCRSVEIIMVEVIVRNIIAGSMAKRVGIEEGTIPENTIYEICYKNDDYGDPLINDHHAVAMGLATYDELKTIYSMTEKINEILKTFFDELGIILVDFKLEFGRTTDGKIILADEISPDTCRLWDKETGEKLDKDRFRRDLGNIEGAYQEILSRLGAK